MPHSSSTAPPRPLSLLALLLLPLAFATSAGVTPSPSPAFTLSFPAARSTAPLDGRLLVLIARDGEAEGEEEPRFQVDDGPGSQLVFGIDVEGWAPGTAAEIDGSAFGYPLHSLAEVPAGEYWVQGLLNRYETFHRTDGHTVKLPPDRGEGQVWNEKPGNLYSTARKVRLDPAGGGTIELVLDREIPPVEPPADTAWIEHVEIESPRLSAFWGRPVTLGAWVLLPAGWAEHPEAQYPMAILHGHFPASFEGFRTAPPDPDLPPTDLAWLAENCPNGHGPGCGERYRWLRQKTAYDFFERWQGPDFPRVLIVVPQHANPYYDDSYAVNSANIGPYGDALTYELLPAVAERFRGLGPWARGLYGGSTGGWEALAAQVFYPDDYNGSWASCPDPVDFRFYQLVDVYADGNAYHRQGEWQRIARPGARDYLGRVRSTIESQNLMELALGTHSRSGGQWDVWEAVFGPVGADGYPRRIWDKRTGAIDPETAAYWREHYDLRAILARDWPALGPKLRGKLHVYVGDMDTYYLNDAVYLLEDFLRGTADPPAEAEVVYGDRAEHCWSGDPENPNSVSRLTYHQRFLPKMVEHWLATAPPGADTTSWRY